MFYNKYLTIINYLATTKEQPKNSQNSLLNDFVLHNAKTKTKVWQQK